MVFIFLYFMYIICILAGVKVVTPYLVIYSFIAKINSHQKYVLVYRI